LGFVEARHDVDPEGPHAELSQAVHQVAERRKILAMHRDDQERLSALGGSFQSIRKLDHALEHLGEHGPALSELIVKQPLAVRLGNPRESQRRGLGAQRALGL